jgi:hypothetical protein
MTRSGTILWAALAEALVLGVPALAAEPEAPSEVDAALEEADRRFVAGDLAGALAVLAPVCSGSERPECLFSLGAIQHGLGHCPEARGYYRRYREVAPRGERIEEVSAALEEVEGRCGPSRRAAPSGAMAPAGTAPPSAPLASPAGATEPGRAPPSAAPASSSLTSQLMLGSFALSGAAAVSTLVFGVLATQAADDCQDARRYDASFRDVCEEDGPRYQGLWQGFALASASFLGIGITLWWIDSSSTASVGVSGAGTPLLSYRRSF